jgi:hypothetical protein
MTKVPEVPGFGFLDLGFRVRFRIPSLRVRSRFPVLFRVQPLDSAAESAVDVVEVVAA